MRRLLLFAVVGFFAQLVDGTLGMAYGVTSSSLLLMFGVAPAVVSASIHISEIATTAASGTSHWKFGNVDKELLWRLMIPGSISAFIGAAFLSSLPGDMIEPYISILLLAMGVFIVYRFLFKFTPAQPPAQGGRLKGIFLVPLGAAAGFLDAIGGGGWGPVNTPFLLSRKGLTPRKVIGTVDTSEFAVAISASLGFLIFLGLEQMNWLWVLAFALGGVLAAPLAAWLVKVIPSHLMGILVGGLIIVTNTRTLLSTLAPGAKNLQYVIYSLLIFSWIVTIFYVERRQKRVTNRIPQGLVHENNQNDMIL